MPLKTTTARALLVSSLLVVEGASDSPPLTPGAWTFTNTPTAASLDGRPLRDLPVSESTSETACLTPTAAARPATWLARDLLNDCTLDRQEVTDGLVSIGGHCPPRADGYAPGRLTITGRYTANSYDLTFSTVSPDENGTMRFDGRMTGRRTGACTPSR